MNKKVTEFIKSNKIEIALLSLFLCAYIIYYLNSYYVELIYLPWLMGDIDFVHRFLEHKLNFKDYFRLFDEQHGMFGYNFILLINLVFFKLSSIFDNLLNTVLIFATGIIVILNLKEIKRNFPRMYIMFLFISLFINFNFMQGTSVSMETGVRLGLFAQVVNFALLDMFLKANKKSIFFIITLYLSIFFSINIFGTLYSFAGYPVILIILLFRLFKSKTRDKDTFVLFVSYILFGILYFIQYGFFTKGESLGGISIVSSLYYWLTHIQKFLLNIINYNGSSLLGYGIIADGSISLDVYFYIGLFYTFTIIITLGIYFKYKFYHITYIPILFSGYSFFVIVLALIGRYNFAGDLWGANPWYHVHTKFALLSTMYILFIFVNQNFHRIKQVKLSIYSVYIILLSILLCSSIYEVQRAKYVLYWYQEKQKYMFYDSQDLPIDSQGLTPLLVDKMTTYNSMLILREYKLSIFNDKPYFYKINSFLDKKSIVLNGERFQDQWVSNSFEFLINTEDKKILHIELFIPSEFTPNEISVYIDDEFYLKTNYTKEGSQAININLTNQGILRVKLISNVNIVPKELGLSEDERNLSYILNKVEMK